MGAVTIIPDPTRAVDPRAISRDLLTMVIVLQTIVLLSVTFTAELLDRTLHTNAKFRPCIETILDTVSSHASVMRSAATGMLNASNKTTERATGAVETSNQTSRHAAVAASATVEMSPSINEISRQLSRTNDLVGIAVKDAGASNAQVGGLAQAAQKIDDVIKLIQTVAGQTNLLSLNATIEASPAGEAGPGFAVVPSRVKTLSVQTAKATEEIAHQITAAQVATKTAVEAIQRINQRMTEIK